MRAHEKRGITKMELQGIVNHSYASRLRINERGWPIPYTVGDGFTALRRAFWHRYYQLTVCGRHASAYHRSEELRYWRYNMKEARGCKAPLLP